MYTEVSAAVRLKKRVPVSRIIPHNAQEKKAPPQNSKGSPALAASARPVSLRISTAVVR